MRFELVNVRRDARARDQPPQQRRRAIGDADRANDGRRGSSAVLALAAVKRFELSPRREKRVVLGRRAAAARDRAVVEKHRAAAGRVGDRIEHSGRGPVDADVKQRCGPVEEVAVEVAANENTSRDHQPCAVAARTVHEPCGTTTATNE